jgi:hypothetical protein
MGKSFFKRLLNLARQIRAEISDDHFVEILNNWPALRQAALSWWQSGRNPEVKLSLISKLFSGGDLVDDAAKMDATIALVAAQTRFQRALGLLLQRLATVEIWYGCRINRID